MFGFEFVHSLWQHFGGANDNLFLYAFPKPFLQFHIVEINSSGIQDVGFGMVFAIKYNHTSGFCAVHFPEGAFFPLVLKQVLMVAKVPFDAVVWEPKPGIGVYPIEGLSFLYAFHILSSISL
jgi:hypothetical protein